jgi:hypothetical protein
VSDKNKYYAKILVALKYNQQDATFSPSIYFYKLIYMFQAVPPPIIRRRKLYIQRQVLSNQYCCLLLSWMRWNVYIFFVCVYTHTHTHTGCTHTHTHTHTHIEETLSIYRSRVFETMVNDSRKERYIYFAVYLTLRLLMSYIYMTLVA